MDVLQIVKLKEKSIQLVDSDWLLAIEEVEQAIKNYCNIDKVPEELKFVVANMVIDLVRYQKANDVEAGVELDNLGAGDIASISIGDTSIKLATNDEAASQSTAARKSHIPDLDEIVMNNRAHLNRFRRMVW